MSPAELAVAALLSLPWQQASYVLICMCSIVWLANQFKAIISSLFVVVGYLVACSVCYMSYAMFRWTLVHGTAFDSVRSFGDVIISSMIKHWAHNGTEETR